MSSVLESQVGEAFVFENADGGLDIVTDELYTIIGEKPGEASAADPGDDNVLAGGSNNVIYTGVGDDVILGGAGDDIIISGDGDDVIIGGAGNDTMIGGEGADTFLYELDHFANGEVDTIVNFESGVDQIIFGADVNTDLLSVEDNEVKYDGETIIVGDDDFELF